MLLPAACPLHSSPRIRPFAARSSSLNPITILLLSSHLHARFPYRYQPNHLTHTLLLLPHPSRISSPPPLPAKSPFSPTLHSSRSPTAISQITSLTLYCFSPTLHSPRSPYRYQPESPHSHFIAFLSLFTHHVSPAVLPYTLQPLPLNPLLLSHSPLGPSTVKPTANSSRIRLFTRKPAKSTSKKGLSADSPRLGACCCILPVQITGSSP